MKINFSKYQGTGNDFIIIDNRNSSSIFEKNAIAFLCDRRFGIGADGLILLHNISDHDFEMVFFNSDGRETTMCGNGGRCIVAFAKLEGIIKKNITRFFANDNPYSAEITGTKDNVTFVRLNMNDVIHIQSHDDAYEINTGSPHYVKFVTNLDNYDVYNEGKNIRNSHKYHTEGINVNFVEIINENNLKPDSTELHISMRTYERGVEDETLSCGTGAVAAAIAYALKTEMDITAVNIQTPGGNLKVSFKKEHHHFVDIWLEGPATFVYKGEIEI